jgi:DNA (cytosine-5)-methyltransferase 1
MKKSKKFISLFSGAGIFDLGFEKAGFVPLVSIDSDYDACQSLKLNSNHTVINKKIEDVCPKKLTEEIKGLKDIDLLIGGPPCQPYSKSKYGVKGNSSGKDDHRFLTLKNYFKFVRELEPKIFIIENVPQFISGKNEGVKNYIYNSVKYLNLKSGFSYKLNIQKINCNHYGVPQARERVIIIGTRLNYKEAFPQITHFGEFGDKQLGLLPVVTSGEAISSLNKFYSKTKKLMPTGKWSELLPSIPAGENYLWHTNAKGGKNIFKWRSRYWNFLLKLDPSKPSWTITANPGHMTGPFHWTGRRLHVNELKRIQTVPLDYILYGTDRSKIKQLGNAVPSLIGEVLGKHLQENYFFEKNTDSNLKLSIKKESFKRADILKENHITL